MDLVKFQTEIQQVWEKAWDYALPRNTQVMLILPVWALSICSKRSAIVFSLFTIKTHEAHKGYVISPISHN
jgi:hypothetical protein